MFTVGYYLSSRLVLEMHITQKKSTSPKRVGYFVIVYLGILLRTIVNSTLDKSECKGSDVLLLGNILKHAYSSFEALKFLAICWLALGLQNAYSFLYQQGYAITVYKCRTCLVKRFSSESRFCRAAKILSCKIHAQSFMETTGYVIKLSFTALRDAD